MATYQCLQEISSRPFLCGKNTGEAGRREITGFYSKVNHVGLSAGVGWGDGGGR